MRSAVLGGDNIGFLFRVHGQEFHSFRRTRGSKNLREFPLRPSETFPAANGTLDFAFNTLKSKIGLLCPLVHHGTADRSVAVENSRRLQEDLRAQKTPVDLFLYEGADHGFLAYARPFYRPDDAKLAWRRATEFLQCQLR
jgi:acetyl esterase/lipase